MKNSKIEVTANMTKGNIMKLAHKNAKTYVGNYSACLSLALKEIYTSIKMLKENASKPQIDTSNISSHTFEIVMAHIKKVNKKGKAYISNEEAQNVLPLVFDGSDDIGTITNVMVHLPKLFKAIAKKFMVNNSTLLSIDDIYMESISNIVAKLKDGYIIQNLYATFKNETMNVVKKEMRRNDNKKFQYSSINDTENNKNNAIEKEMEKNNYSSYGKIPVDRIIRDMDMKHIFTPQEMEMVKMRLKGMKKVEIDKALGQRLDRKWMAIEEKMEAYINYSYSEKVYAI